MTTDISRRRLVAALPGAVPALALPAPLPEQAKAAEGEGDLLAAARERTRRNAEQLGKLQVPMAAEPAFKFTA